MVWIFLWRRLLPNHVHLLGSQQEVLLALHMAGQSLLLVSIVPFRIWFLLLLLHMNLTISLFKGRHATQDEVAASAIQAVHLDQQYSGEPVQVRVTMGKEPRHFMSIFKGKMVIFEVQHYIYIIEQFLYKHVTFSIVVPVNFIIVPKSCFREAHPEKGQLIQNHQSGCSRSMALTHPILKQLKFQP